MTNALTIIRLTRRVWSGHLNASYTHVDDGESDK